MVDSSDGLQWNVDGTAASTSTDQLPCTDPQSSVSDGHASAAEYHSSAPDTDPDPTVSCTDDAPVSRRSYGGADVPVLQVSDEHDGNETMTDVIDRLSRESSGQRLKSRCISFFRSLARY